MFQYLVKRILYMIPTFLGITLFSFIIINSAPGGPIEQKLQAIRFGDQSGGAGANSGSQQGTAGVSEDVLEALKKQYGFDKPVHVRYWIWLTNIAKFDFGESFVFEEPVIDVIKSKFPVSLQFGLTTLFLTYLICIPLGIAKAIKSGTTFDSMTGVLLNVSYAIPPLVLGIYLITFFAGGSYFDWFPIGGVKSDDYDTLTAWGQIKDRVHHFVLPLICYTIGSFTELTTLTRNSMLDVIKQDYVRTARAKGLTENVVHFKHALRNALIPVATGIGGFLSVFLSGSLLIENLFQLDGIGRLSYQSILQRDYNVIMAIIFLSSLFLMLGRLISDITYVLVDPRIDFK